MPPAHSIEPLVPPGFRLLAITLERRIDHARILLHRDSARTWWWTATEGARTYRGSIGRSRHNFRRLDLALKNAERAVASYFAKERDKAA